MDAIRPRSHHHIFIDPDSWLQIPTGLKRRLRFFCLEEDHREPDHIRFTFAAGYRETFMRIVADLAAKGVNLIADAAAEGGGK